MSCLPVDLPRGKSMLLPAGKCATCLAWCWTFLASKVGSFLASADRNAVKVERMRMVLRKKFDVHDRRELWQKLQDTGDAVLIEDSKTDAFWGIGKRGTGKNMLGNLLMERRNSERERQSAEAG